MTTANGGRERLLAKTMEHLWDHGIGDLTLRQLALALGTSHRMLIYHFGSKTGLLAEVARSIDLEQQTLVRALIDRVHPSTPGDEVRRMWKYATRSEFRRYLRLFFEVYGRALRASGGDASDFLDGVVEPWVERLADMFCREGTTDDEARADARLTVAVLRGLALDVLATGDVVAGNRAMERFLLTI